MEVKELNVQRVCEILNEIIELEMAGVVRYAPKPVNGNRSNRFIVTFFARTSK